jgi:hypothetical protein
MAKEISVTGQNESRAALVCTNGALGTRKTHSTGPNFTVSPELRKRTVTCVPFTNVPLADI